MQSLLSKFGIENESIQNLKTTVLSKFHAENDSVQDLGNSVLQKFGLKQQSTSEIKVTIEESKERKATLVEKKSVSRDSVMFTFQFVGEGKLLPIGKHIRIHAPNPCYSGIWNGAPDNEEETIERKYTPISININIFVIVVKIYSPNEKFSSGGKMSQYLNNLKDGEEINIELPYGLIEYLGNGQFKRSKTLLQIKQVGMIAGGSGITPMIRLLEESLTEKNDETTFSLIFANRTEEDVILKSRLDELASLYPLRFKVFYILSQPKSTQHWKGETGYVNKELMMKFLPCPSSETLILVCGPNVMIKSCCKPNLEEIGYKQIWDF